MSYFPQVSGDRRRSRARTLVQVLAPMLALAMLTGGCTIISIEDDRAARARQSETFDARAYTDDIWMQKALPALDARARPLPQLLAALTQNATEAERQFGRQAGEGSPFTYVVSGEGVITAIDRASPAGTVTLRVGDRQIHLQTGPYVSGTALRDSLDFISFNDFTNQVAFADVSRTLNTKALAVNAAALSDLREGQTVRFTGVFAATDENTPLRLTPVRLEVAP